MKKLIGLVSRTGRVFVLLLIVTLLVLPNILPNISVGADSPTTKANGTYYNGSLATGYIATVDYMETAKTGTYTVKDNKIVSYEYSSRIDGSPNFANGLLINCSWLLKGTTYTSGNNLFATTVSGTSISMSRNGETLSWNPTLLINGKGVSVKFATPTLLTIDPINENYPYNTLEWDYGICVRHLRVIEGLVQDIWIFDQDPKGEVQIKENAVKSAGFIWQVAPFATDAAGNSIPITTDKIVKAKDFVLTKDLTPVIYPVTIDPTTEVYYTSASDGYLQDGFGSYTYAYWNSTTGNGLALYNTSTTISIGQNAGMGYNLWRSYLYFNTSSIPDNATISSANVSIRGSLDKSTKDFGITIQSGMPAHPTDPLTKGDWWQGYYTGDGGSKNTSGYSTSYMNISMNSTGIGWINLSGGTTLCLRSSREIAMTTPTGDEYISIKSYETGAGYIPYLEVVYTVPAGDNWTLSVTGSPVAGGTPTFTGSSPFSNASVVNISCNMSAGYTFNGWTPTTNIANASLCNTSITMLANASLTANYVVVSVIAITNDPSTWTINGITGTGYIDPATTYYSNPLGDLFPPGATVNDSVCYFTVTNSSSNVPLDLTVTFGNFSGGDTMTNSNLGSNGATTFGVYAWYSGMTYSNKVIAKDTGSSLLYNEWTGSTLKWGVEITTRSDPWTNGNISTASMTITATED